MERFEIREYLDEEGSVVRDEVVDLDAEVRGLKSFCEQHQAQLPDDKRATFQELMSKLTIDDTVEDKDNVIIQW